MHCQATRINVILAALIAGSYALSSRIALGETSTVSAEIKPIALLVNAAPGSTGIAAEGEINVSTNVTVFAGVSHMDLNLSDRMVDNMRDDKHKDEPLAKEIRTDSVNAGGRYYWNPEGSSWYAGGQIGGGATKVEWVTDESKVKDTSTFYQAGIEGGYRWTFDSGLTIRLGGGLAANTIKNREFTPESDSEANTKTKDKVKDKAPNNLTTESPSFDVGLGYRF